MVKPNDDFSQWTEEDLKTEIQSFMEWVDGDPENGPRAPSDSEVVYLEELNTELQRRKSEAKNA
jgi:hypothetical protein